MPISTTLNDCNVSSYTTAYSFSGARCSLYRSEWLFLLCLLQCNSTGKRLKRASRNFHNRRASDRPTSQWGRGSRFAVSGSSHRSQKRRLYAVMLSFCSSVCRLWNLWSHSLRGSTGGERGLIVSSPIRVFNPNLIFFSRWTLRAVGLPDVAWAVGQLHRNRAPTWFTVAWRTTTWAVAAASRNARSVFAVFRRSKSSNKATVSTARRRSCRGRQAGWRHGQVRARSDHAIIGSACACAAVNSEFTSQLYCSGRPVNIGRRNQPVWPFCPTTNIRLTRPVRLQALFTPRRQFLW